LTLRMPENTEGPPGDLPRWASVYDGRGTWTRTKDLRIWNPLLYQLSYTPKAGRT
jgi:hypothetical protein